MADRPPIRRMPAEIKRDERGMPAERHRRASRRLHLRHVASWPWFFDRV